MISNKKKHFRVLLMLTLACIITLFTAVIAHAAPTGTTMAHPFNATFGSKHTASWTKDTNNVFFYSKVTINETGLLKMTFSKPFDSDGEYGRLMITVSDEDGEPLWSSDTYKMNESASPNYKFNVGLKPGSYFVSIVPKFYVRSGLITTDFVYEFEANPYVEIEPNSSTATATQLEKGIFYSATLGNGGGDYGRNNFFKIKLKKNSSYRLVFDNYGEIDETTALIDILGPSNKEVRMGDSQVNSSGYEYFEFIAPSTGTYYIKLYNYTSNPINYRLKVSDALKPGKTTIRKFFSLTNELSIYAKDVSNVKGYQVQYSTKKANVKKAKKYSSDDFRIEIPVSRTYSKYYARVRTYKYIDGTKVYSSWSKIKCFT